MVKLSASRIKSLSNCSWVYWANYILKLPSPENTGAILGSCCHEILEGLADVSNFSIYQKILEEGSIKNYYFDFCEEFLKEKNISLEDQVPDKDRKFIRCFDLVDMMVLTALRYDFYGKGSIESRAEQAFDIITDSYNILGYIDRLFVYKDKVIIRDYKSSKEVFKGKDVDDNVQDLIYKLAVSKEFPDKEIHTEFIFLQHGLVKTPSVCKKEMRGFELYLGEIQNAVDNFTERDAIANLARDRGYLDSYHGFSGALMCGRGESPDHKKKDGSLMWSCGHKFAKYFWVVLKNGEVVSSHDDEPEIKEGFTKEKRKYYGCPAWSFLEYNKKMRKEFDK